ncbi:TPA: hypothetical protein JG864_001029 [Enterobacter hormaechei subsp. steigerwaltii]|nr:hypothetical protein [Enterobacter hormaechei subsp. steigerwaltii]
MKLFEMEGFLRGKCFPGDMKVNETNAEYLVRKFAEADAKCAALAAENAALKSKAAELVHEASEVYSAYNAKITESDGDFMDMQTLQEMQCVETPATDSFLAEMRAQGVEMFAKHCQKRHGEMMKSEPNEAASNQAITATRRAGEFALYFAAQLRKGVQS